MREEEIIKNIKSYCSNVKMNSNNLVVTKLEDGSYVASDKNTSLLFDKDGNVKSLPMYKMYGKGNLLIGKISAILMITVIIVILIISIFSLFNK